MTIRFVLLAALVLPLIASSCSSNGGSGERAALPAPLVVAEVNGREITLQEVDSKIAGEIYDARSGALEELVTDLVIETEAERRGLTTDELIEQQIEQLGAVDDAEIAAFFEENRSRMRPDETLENVGPQIRGFLEQQREQAALGALRDTAAVSIRLEPPRIEIAAIGPSRGPDDAPVTIVEFSDYQCPFCGRAEPIVEQVLARYPDSVRLVYRHFPLDSIHPQARPAAIAAVCADAQGKFWEFHAKLFTSQRDLSAEKLTEFANEVELDLAALDVCRESEEAAEIVAADYAAGQAAGTTGTPAFFVNGIKLTGARPLEDFVEVIDAELAKAPDGA